MKTFKDLYVSTFSILSEKVLEVSDILLICVYF